MRAKLRCVRCGAEYDVQPKMFSCPKCGGLLEVVIEPEELPPFSEFTKRSRMKGIWRFAELLPVKSGSPVTMGEGNTPLIRLEKLEKVIGVRRLYAKFEGANPTGSFKDRGMSLAVTVAKEVKARAVVAASTGNTAASAAAYSARAGLKTFLILPSGKVALGKLAQSLLHGAVVVELEGNFDAALEAVKELAKMPEFYPLNSFNPWRLEGQKTLAFELFEEIGVPDVVVVPVGNAGNISAIWKGFKELKEFGYSEALPKMVGVQAEGASPIASAFKAGLNAPLFTDSPETVATAIRIGKPVNWMKAWKAVTESGGTFEVVSDSEIIRAQRLLAREEGVAAEPAGAASLAGVVRLASEGYFNGDEVVTVVVTGHGLKDPDSVKFHPANKLTALNVEDAVEKVVSALKVVA
ncbi:threonine synthase [Ignicoccus hospitalis]|uniref:Threonine synthase n=1 Tax=Ignicoccus hospitalis (strain KIN4/I / DSM 18386 / JCM 14125) TaxID=453591 RepID=A8ABB1_IGNH4|nr:L-threonine synthase [Ignicoccus hospitalis KIN4/I]